MTLRPERVASLLGVQIPRAEIEEILRRLGMQVAGAGDVLGVIPPSHRFDIAIEQDLIEEVGRIHGFDNIPRSDAQMPQRPQPSTERAVTRERLRLLLVDRGYQEVITYSFVDPRLQRLMFPRQKALALENPLSTELGEMRVSLWPGLVETLRFNQRGSRSACASSRSARGSRWSGGRLVESQAIAGLVTGAALPEQWGAEKSRGGFLRHQVGCRRPVCADRTAVRNKLCRGRHTMACIRGAAPPSSTATIRVGWIGQLQPDLSRKLDLRGAPWVFEIGIDPSFRSEVPVFREISKFPAIRRDLAVLIDESVTLDELRESVNLAAKGLLRELAVFDVYRGKGVEPGRKSIALGLILQETSRTLTDQEADAVVAAVVERVKGDLKAGIRE